MSDLTKILIGSLAAILVLFGAYGKGRSDGKAVERSKFNDASIAQLARIEELERQGGRITEEKDREWSSKVRELQTRVDVLSSIDVEPIRLCVPRRSAGPTEVPAVASGDNRPDTGGGHAVQAGEDIRQELLVYGQQCETLRRRLIKAEEWASEQKALRE